MNCLCAIEEYFVATERKGFDKLSCDGNGNFSPLQCIDTTTCYCADINGRQISEEFNFECANHFITENAPGYDLRTICTAMRATLSNPKKIIDENTQLFFNNVIKSYEPKGNADIPVTRNQVCCHSSC